jgi:protein-disulfide isomerase
MRDQTELVFKHLPLAQHSWARAAASYSACASLQSTAAFLTLSHYLFKNQAEITLDNLRDKILAGLSPVPGVDMDKLVACVSNKDGTAIVDRDIAVAQQLNVNSTPTLFVGVRRALTPHSAEDLRLLLQHELTSKNSTAALNAQPGTR